MAAGTVAYTDTRGNKDYLGMIASQIGKRIKQSSNMAAEERAFAAKKAEEGGTSLEEAGIGKGYFFKRALGSRFGGDKIARTRGRLGAEGPGKDPTKNYKQRFRGGFDYNVTNEIQSATVPLSSALTGGLRGVENGLGNISQSLATMGRGMSDLAKGQNDLAKATYFNGMVLRVMVTDLKRQQSRLAGRREERSLELGRPRLSGGGGGTNIKGLLPGGSRGGGGGAGVIGDVARGAGQFLTNRSAYKAAGSAVKGGSSAAKSLRATGGAITKIPEVATSVARNAGKISAPLQVANTTKKLISGGSALLGKSEDGAKIASKLLSGGGSSAITIMRPGEAGKLSGIVDIAASTEPKALAATGAALVPGGGLASLGDEGLELINNSPDVIKSLNKADDVSDGVATAKAIAAASDAGATKAGMLSFLKNRKPKGLVRGSSFTRMMVKNPAGKMFLKKLPLIGAIAGGIFAVQRLMEGDFLGAGLELGSGILGATGLAPASLALDGLLLARDFGAVPFAKGGVLTGKRPVNALMGEAGPEIVTPLNDETFIKFGEGILNAQKRNRTDSAKIQAEGLKQYYEGMGGWNKFGKAFEGIFDTLKNIISSIRLPNLGDIFRGGGGGGGGNIDASTIDADSPQAKALIATIREVEGTSGEKGYDTWFGGRNEMNMTDMSLQQVYDEQTKRMNAGETTYNGRSSAAVGVGQFMNPLKQAREMYAARGEEFDPTKIKFNQRLQNELLLDLAARKRGIDPSKTLTKADFDILQMEWAGLGTYYGQTKRTTDDSLKIYQGNLKEAEKVITPAPAPKPADPSIWQKWMQSNGIADKNATSLNRDSSRLSMLSGLTMGLGTPTIINNSNYYTQSGSNGGDDGDTIGSKFDFLSAFNAQYSLFAK